MPILLRKSKSGLKESLKAAGFKLPHGYDIKRRKAVRKKTVRKKFKK